MSSASSAIDYTSKDYDGFKSSLLTYASQVMPQWQSRSEGDFGVAMVELMAYMGDILSYYGDRMQDEAYLSTATQRQSILQIANLLGYIPSNGVAANGTVTLQSANPGPAVTVPAGTNLTTDYVAAIDGPLVYETQEDVTVPANGGTAVVNVAHGVTYSMTPLGTSTGLPGQRFRLPQTSVISGTERIFVDVASSSGSTASTEEWLHIDFLIDGDPTSKVFSTYVDSSGATWIEFGDGLNGAVPNNGLNVYSTYRVGGGVVGNIASGLIIGIDNTGLSGAVSVAVDSTSTPLSSAMTGGADPESNDQIRANAPRVFRTQNRLVTLSDYEDAALGVPGVLRASAVAGAFSAVTVYVVGPSGGTPASTLLNNVQSALNAKALAGVTVTAAAPSFVSINVGSSGSPLVVKVMDNAKQSVVQAAVSAAVQQMLSFSAVDFGERLTLSDFYSAIMSVPGVQWVQIPMFARSDASQSGTADIACRAWEIPVLGNYYVNMTGGIV